MVESMNSDNHVQAACYGPETKQMCGRGMGIVAIRGTVSFRGLLQDLAVGTPFMRRAIRHAIKEACSFYLKCKAKYPALQLYITGHSLGGFIAEDRVWFNKKWLAHCCNSSPTATLCMATGRRHLCRC